MKQAVIYYKNQLAGLLSEDEEGYYFVYDPRDRFALLLAMCKDCIGCVSVIPKTENNA